MIVGFGVEDEPRRLWRLACAGAVTSGMVMKDCPDLGGMFQHVARSIGTDFEGLPSVDRQDHPMMRTKELLKFYWPTALACFSGRFPESKHDYGVAPLKWRPTIAALVANGLINETQAVVKPRNALILVMEAAIYGSKLDPAEIEP